MTTSTPAENPPPSADPATAAQAAPTAAPAASESSPPPFVPSQQHTFSLNIEDKDLYKTAVDTRNFEITLFWQRSNYFLVLNTALAVGFFNAKGADPVMSIALALFGAIVSLLWFKVTLGSKYWQCRWEQRLSTIEKAIAGDASLFSASREQVQKDVEDSFAWRGDDGGRFAKLIRRLSFKRHIERKISEHLRGHSVSYNMTLLSLFFVAGWLFLASLASCRLSWAYCR